MAPANPQKLMGIKTSTVKTAAVQPQTQLVAAPADTVALQDISKSLTRIIQLLTQQNLQVTKESEQDRKNQEVARRKKIEFGLENAFSVVKATAQAVVAPVKNILDQIIQYFITLFLGKALLNLINWFANPENQSKVKSIARFLKDWWPSLVAGYLLFGTGLGRVVRSLARVALVGVTRLGVIAFRLAKAIATGKGLKGVGQAIATGGAIGGMKGSLFKLGAAAVATVGTGLAINQFMGGGQEEAPKLEVPEAPAVPAMSAFGGGLADLKTILASTGGEISSKLSPFTSFFSGGGFNDLMGGIVSGPKGIDKVPAMLTDGEFVMSRGAVQKFGVGTLEAMNASGGGTNRPKVVHQRVYAAGGGYIGPDGTMGGVGALRDRYDKEHGAGAYDKESARRKASLAREDAASEAKHTESDYTRNLKNSLKTVQPTSSKKQTALKPLSPPPSLNPKVNLKAPAIVDPKRRDEAEARKKARAEYNSILNNMSHPDYDKAWNDPKFLDKLKSKYRQQTPTTPSAQTQRATPAYVSYVSKYAGFRDAAFAKAKNIDAPSSTNSYNPLDWFKPGGTFGGPRMQARTDYATSKGKYYSSSDQKTYGSYNDAAAAKKSRMVSLASQQRLNKLTWGNVGPDMMPKRFSEENRVRRQEYDKKGGFMGQLGRLGQRMFGGVEANRKLDIQQKASEARAKQAGAASIGRYYSSSDGKYYKDYVAADTARRARKARLAASKPKPKVITPTPKPAPKVVSSGYKPAGGGMGGGRGSGAKPSVPQFSSSKGHRKVANQLNIRT